MANEDYSELKALLWEYRENSSHKKFLGILNRRLSRGRSLLREMTREELGEFYCGCENEQLQTAVLAGLYRFDRSKGQEVFEKLGLQVVLNALRTEDNQGIKLDAYHYVYDRIYGYVYKIIQDEYKEENVQDRDSIKDLCQDLLLKIFERLHQYRGAHEYSFLAWVKTIVRRDVKTDLRKRGRISPNVLVDEGGAYDQERRNRQVVPRAETWDNPEEQLVDKDEEAEVVDLGRMVLEAIKCLPPRQRQIMLMKCKKMRNKDIAQHLGITEVTVARSFMEAKDNLAKYLPEEAWQTLKDMFLIKTRKRARKSKNLENTYE